MTYFYYILVTFYNYKIYFSYCLRFSHKKKFGNKITYFFSLNKIAYVNEQIYIVWGGEMWKGYATSYILT